MTIFNPHIVNYIVIQLSIQKSGIGNFHFYWNVVCLKIKPQSVYTSCDILNPFRFFFRKSWLKMERELEKMKLYAYNSYGFKFTHISCDILNPFRFLFKKSWFKMEKERQWNCVHITRMSSSLVCTSQKYISSP